MRFHIIRGLHGNVPYIDRGFRVIYQHTVDGTKYKFTHLVSYGEYLNIRNPIMFVPSVKEVISKQLEKIKHEPLTDREEFVIRRAFDPRYPNAHTIDYLYQDARELHSDSLIQMCDTIINHDKRQYITVIFHICNNKGGWGKGFSSQLSKMYHKPYIDYKNAYLDNKLVLGTNIVTHFKHPERECIIVNMIAQDGYRSDSNPTPCKAKYVKECFNKFYDEYMIGEHLNHPAIKPEHPLKVLYQMPKIGTGFGGVGWNSIEAILEEQARKGVRIRVCDLSAYTVEELNP